jgi:hypothetical protein
VGAFLRAFWAAFELRETAGARSLRLLRKTLSATQSQQYDERLHFDVVGGLTGHRYRIHSGGIANVDELDTDGQCVRRLCFQPEGGLANGDILLAQKFGLELYEREVLAIANTFSPAGRPIARQRRRQ